MKNSNLLRLSSLVIFCQFAALIASAQVNEPVIAYATVQGAKTGQFKGSSTSKTNKGKIECIGFSYTVKSPTDAASGLPTGKRMEGPVAIVKHFDGSTPQFLQSLYTNETLKSVVIEFYKKSANGQTVLFYTIKLTNAHIAQVSQYAGVSSPEKLIPNTNPNEEIRLTFQKIEVSNIPEKTTASDDWESNN